MSGLFIEILNMSLSAGCAALAVVLIRLLLTKAPRKYAYALWAVVFLRLLCPLTIPLPVSAVPIQPQTIPRDIVYAESPAIQSGLSVVDDAVNHAILPAPAPPAGGASPVQRALEVGAYVWLAGVFALLLYGVIGYLRLQRGIRTAIRIRENIYETDRIQTPFVLGFVRPKIYVPTGIDEKELPYVIAHEQKHIRRLDYLIKPAAFLAACVHWFNPLAWLSYILMARDMELSADEHAMQCSETDIRSEYARSLLALSVRNRRLVSPLAFGETGVKARVKNVLRYQKPALWVSTGAVVIVAAAALLLLSGRASGANEESRGPQTAQNSLQAPLPTEVWDDMADLDPIAPSSPPVEALPEKKVLNLEDIKRINRGELSCGDVLDAYAGDITRDADDPDTSFWTGAVSDPDDQIAYQFHMVLKQTSGMVSISSAELTVQVNAPADPAGPTDGYLSIPFRASVLDLFISYAREGKPIGTRNFASPDGRHAVEIRRPSDVGPRDTGIVFTQDGEPRHGVDKGPYTTALWTPDSRYALVMPLSAQVSFASANIPVENIPVDGIVNAMMIVYDTLGTEGAARVPIYYHLSTNDLFSRFRQAGAMQGEHEFSLLLSSVELLGDTDMALVCELWNDDVCTANMTFHYDFLTDRITEDSIVLQ